VSRTAGTNAAMATEEKHRVRGRRRRDKGDPALLARHNAALRLLRKGIETDGALLLSYVVWPTDEIRHGGYGAA
jgi:hypothetical protein